MKKKCCGKYALKGERTTESALDRQVGSTKHYKDFKIQPIEFITANKLVLFKVMLLSTSVVMIKKMVKKILIKQYTIANY